MQLVCRQDHALTHRAIAVDAEHAERLAAVGFSLLAGVAGAAVQVRLHGAAVAGLHQRHAIAYREDFDPQLMAEDARTLDEGHLSEIPADVGAADANRTNGDERLAWQRPKAIICSVLLVALVLLSAVVWRGLIRRWSFPPVTRSTASSTSITEKPRP